MLSTAAFRASLLVHDGSLVEDAAVGTLRGGAWGLVDFGMRTRVDVGNLGAHSGGLQMNISNSALDGILAGFPLTREWQASRVVD